MNLRIENTDMQEESVDWRERWIDVGGHSLFVAEWGNPDGRPVVFLHGGPGGSVSPKNTVFFDPKRDRVILFDQRGCGRSKPFLSLENNTVDHSVEDIEVIRKTFGIDKWIVFGGSYGSTLALCYAIAHPDRVVHLVLRGIFLGRDEDIRWLYKDGAGYFYPEEFARYRDHLPKEEQADIVAGYYKRLTSEDQAVRDAAALRWANWESGVVNLIPEALPEEVADWQRAISLLECHYFYHHMFWEKDSYILDNIETLRKVPMDIVHGRYDVDCRVSAAYDLAKAHGKARLHIVEAAGHTPYSEPMKAALVKVMDEI